MFTTLGLLILLTLAFWRYEPMVMESCPNCHRITADSWATCPECGEEL